MLECKDHDVPPIVKKTKIEGVTTLGDLDDANNFAEDKSDNEDVKEAPAAQLEKTVEMKKVMNKMIQKEEDEGS